jgi:hypothetical protein
LLSGLVVVEVCHDWCMPIFSLYNIHHSRFWLYCFYKGIFDSLEKYIRW